MLCLSPLSYHIIIRYLPSCLEHSVVMFSLHARILTWIQTAQYPLAGFFAPLDPPPNPRLTTIPALGHQYFNSMQNSFFLTSVLPWSLPLPSSFHCSSCSPLFTLFSRQRSMTIQETSLHDTHTHNFVDCLFLSCVLSHSLLFVPKALLGILLVARLNVHLHI